VTPPHRKTPDYPKDTLVKYMAQVMQLFDPKCEGVIVLDVERACDTLWNTMSDHEKAIAIARVDCRRGA
jgi:hypothetical protein